MYMNGIDIASYQAGIDLSVVPCDFVIVKATEGVTYVNPYCNNQAGQALSLNKKLGLYHFASGGNAIDEANYFVDNIRGYLGKALLVLDWESDAVNCGVDWAKQWLDRVYERTGTKPLIYMSNSVVNSFDWSSVVAGDYGLWNAGYYNGYDPMGYNPDAPIYGGLGAWGGCAIYQYTSSGRLNGWNGNLDLDVFYGDANTWDKYVNASKDVIEELPKPDNKVGLNYRAHCQTYGTLPVAHDGETAGTIGNAKRLEALWIDLRQVRKKFENENIRLAAKVHIQSIGWVEYDNVEHDTLLGTTGQRKRIEAIEFEITGLPEGKKLYYRTHLAKVGWTPWVEGGFSSGTVGLSKAIEAIQIKIE